MRVYESRVLAMERLGAENFENDQNIHDGMCCWTTKVTTIAIEIYDESRPKSKTMCLTSTLQPKASMLAI